MLNKQHKKSRHYLVHVTTKNTNEISVVLRALNIYKQIHLQENVHMHFHTFEVCVSPSVLRGMLDTVPRTICVSYEEVSETSNQTKKPETC